MEPTAKTYNSVITAYARSQKADKVEKAIMLGDASKWGQFIGEKIDFDDREADSYDYQNVYYGRDRGEKDCNHKVYTSEQAYLENGFKSGEDYIYLGKLTGEKDFLGKPMLTWFYAKYDMKKFMPVEGEAIREHIESLKRHLAENVKEAA